MATSAWGNALCDRIQECAKQYVSQYKLEQKCYFTTGGRPCAIFYPYPDKLHGNFIAESYQEIIANEKWNLRLKKRHGTPENLPREWRDTANELDSTNSSDALLMNIFAFPSIAGNGDLGALFGFGYDAPLPMPEFGFLPQLQRNAGSDKTEVDMRLMAKGISTFVESKLTEPEFTSENLEYIDSYNGIDEVFDKAGLFPFPAQYRHGQLMRNILAAHVHNANFVLLCDAMRPDLIRSFSHVVSGVRIPELRKRCKVILWQEVAHFLPNKLKEFLAVKYGINDISCNALEIWQ